MKCPRVLVVKVELPECGFNAVDAVTTMVLKSFVWFFEGWSLVCRAADADEW